MPNSTLSTADINWLQEAVRQEGSLDISIGNRIYTVSHLITPDWFLVDTQDGGALSRLLRFNTRNETRSANLAWRLNNTRHITETISSTTNSNSSQLTQRVSECSFDIKLIQKTCPDSFLICPITLDIPEMAVFMKNSNNSQVCSVYDANAIMQLINTQSSHPLSRDPIQRAMFVDFCDCHFDAKQNNFILKSNA